MRQYGSFSNLAEVGIRLKSILIINFNFKKHIWSYKSKHSW